MFNYIKINNIKGLKECFLNNLGKICVLCGKNNSGKTTILEGIENDKSFSYGMQINKEIIEKFVNNTKGRLPFGGRTEGIYKKEVNKLLSSEKVWFSDQSTFFVEKLNSILKKKFSKHIFPSAVFKQHFDNFFNKQKTSILLPPKRHIERKTTIETHQEIKPDGEGVLNRLLNWKNKPINSEKYQIYYELLNAFNRVTNGYKFDVVTDEGENGGENTISLQFTDNGKNYRFADDCGLGLQDIIVILFFSLNPKYNLLLIEEPESHIHPEMQRRLLNQFKNNISTNKQFILSTHSNIFLDLRCTPFLVPLSNVNSVVSCDETKSAQGLPSVSYN
ncbi:MAG TPA: ATP-binding protein [Anaerolineae bacterium]|nr:ATP-binding protein [Anaerolineae bacterium]